MNKVHPRGYLGRQDWLWWAHTSARRASPGSAPTCVATASSSNGGSSFLVIFPGSELGKPLRDPLAPRRDHRVAVARGAMRFCSWHQGQGGAARAPESRRTGRGH